MPTDRWATSYQRIRAAQVVALFAVSLIARRDQGWNSSGSSTSTRNLIGSYWRGMPTAFGLTALSWFSSSDAP
jgi:hypothetical protein